MTEADKPAEIASANDTANFPATARPEVPGVVSGGAPLDGATLGASALSVPVPNRDPGGAPKGNLNRARHGGSMTKRLIIGELPKELSHAKRMVRAYRRDLEAAVTAKHKDVSLHHAHIIDEAVGWELHGAICRWLLQHKFVDMSNRDMLACSQNIANARTARNRAIASLGLSSNADMVAAYYSSPEPQETTQEAAQCE